MKVVLIGFMGAGKSKVGRLLAKQLGWPHFDTDEMIQKQVGAPIADIINKQGETAFRKVERKVVALVGVLDRCVISTGGGVPLDAANMKQLSQASEIIWLKLSPETALKRAGRLETRPLIDKKDPLGSIRSRMADREKFYAAAQHTIETDHLEPEQVVKKIVSQIPSLSQ